MDNTKIIDDAELKRRLDARPAPFVTKEQIEERIVSRSFIVPHGTTLTICLLKLDNGYSVRGESACVNPANFDQAVGERYAYEDAFKKLWPLFGFLLAEDGFRAAVKAGDFVPSTDGGLTLYRSRKLVAAVRITGITGEAGEAVSTLLGEDGEVVEVTQAWLDKHKPELPGYFVRYADGCESWSPAEPFEQGNIKV